MIQIGKEDIVEVVHPGFGNKLCMSLACMSSARWNLRAAGSKLMLYFIHLKVTRPLMRPAYKSDQA